MSPKARLVHLFLSLFPPHDSTRRPGLSQLRDALAAMLVVDALFHQGFRLGNVLFNFPPFGNDASDTLAAVNAHADEGDLITTATRAPVSDEEQGDLRPVRRGYTTLEEAVLRVWERYFRVLSRGHIILDRGLCELLLAGYADRSDIFFFRAKGARYKMLGRRRYQGPARSAAFLVRERELWPGGPGYLGFFGMDAVTTLIWAYLLRERHPELLSEPGFVMVELSGPPLPIRPTDLSFADAWKAQVLIQKPL